MLFGITPLGWVHTLGSLPAIPAAAYMFAVQGRIVPRSPAGLIYLVSMVIGAVTVFLVTHMPAGHVVGALTLLFLAIGYGIGRTSLPPRLIVYVETIVLSVTAFLLMLPTVSEILRRVPDGHPFVTDLKSPLFLGAQASILVALIVGVTAQIIYLRRQGQTIAS